MEWKIKKTHRDIKDFKHKNLIRKHSCSKRRINIHNNLQLVKQKLRNAKKSYKIIKETWKMKPKNSISMINQASCELLRLEVCNGKIIDDKLRIKAS